VELTGWNRKHAAAVIEFMHAHMYLAAASFSIISRAFSGVIPAPGSTSILPAA
jgi:hypothetical protein